MWDWFHVYLENGVYAKEVTAFFACLEEHKLGLGNFRLYISFFIWPKGYAGGQYFGAKNTTNCSGSEMLSIAPVLRKYITDRVIPKGVCSDQCNSM